jgi:hypothetical protein
MMLEQHPFEASPHQSEAPAYQPLTDSCATGAQWKIEGAPHPWNRKLLGNARDRLQHGWKQVGVLVGVQVSGPDARIEHAPNLAL